jgi:hypothetical protein
VCCPRGSGAGRATCRSHGELAGLLDLPTAELAARLAEGNQLYLARLAGRAVAFGWSASRRASFGSPQRTFELPVGERYLWGFATLPAWLGRAIYPRLLQHILRAESDAQRFWILHRATNEASGRGIARAGFRPVDLSLFPGVRIG